MSMPPFPTRTNGLGDNSNVLEPTIHNAVNNGGYVEDFPIPLSVWRDKNFASIGTSAGATPYMALTHTNLPVITWRQDAAATDLIRLSWQVPGSYDPTVDQLYFIATLRKNDSSTDENATLAMQIQMRQFMPGNVNPALAATTVPATTNLVAGETALTAMDAVVKRTLPAPSQLISQFLMTQFDLGADRRNTALSRDTITDPLRIKPLDVLSIEFGPDATVGTTDMLIEMAGSFFRLVRNVSISHRGRRNRLDSDLLLPNGPSTSTTEQYIR